MKTFRIHRDINAENLDDALAWLDEIAGEGLTETGTLDDMFEIEEYPLEQGDEVYVLEIARTALDDESILEQLDISDEYAHELKEKIEKVTEEKVSVS